MGDVAGLLDPKGTLVGTYEYDPYGKLIKLNHNSDYTDTDGILERNPFRYRGYYYDVETGWYYLQSRYYDPAVKRFINADTTDLLTNDCVNLMQYNLFAYCNDNPVGNSDSTGKFDVAVSATLICAMLLAAVAAYELVAYYNSVNCTEQLITQAKEWARSQEMNKNDKNQSVYVLKDANKNVVYVGRTCQVEVRRYQHEHDPDKKI